MALEEQIVAYFFILIKACHGGRGLRDNSTQKWCWTARHGNNWGALRKLLVRISHSRSGVIESTPDPNAQRYGQKGSKALIGLRHCRLGRLHKVKFRSKALTILFHLPRQASCLTIRFGQFAVPPHD